MWHPDKSTLEKTQFVHATASNQIRIQNMS